MPSADARGKRRKDWDSHLPIGNFLRKSELLHQQLHKLDKADNVQNPYAWAKSGRSGVPGPCLSAFPECIFYECISLSAFF